MSDEAGHPVPPPAATVSSSSSSSSSSPLPGRVVRLHFQCRATLPIGSFLRVTGSSLWGPGNSSSSSSSNSGTGMSNAMMHSDPTEATASETTVGAAAASLEESGTSGSLESVLGATASGLYTSSVEMVTTPETYPLWRTRTPVIVVLNRRHSTIKQRVQHHYYRYLVIAPGMGNNSTSIGHESSEQHNMLTVSTSSEYMGSTIVRQWEDPYQNNVAADSTTAGTATSTSFVSDAATSVASFVSQNKDTEHGMVSSWNDYLNLPYRTLDIDLTQLDHVSQQHAMDTTGSGGTNSATGHVVTVPLDTWNDADDASFQPYLIREAVRAGKTWDSH
jgi:hypothetical protein